MLGVLKRGPILTVKTALLSTAVLLLSGLSAIPAAAQNDSWSTAASMSEARAFQSDTLLDDGRVLVAGGFDGSRAGPPVLNSAELYDPNTDRWTRTGSLGQARAAHVAVLLKNGRALVAGGLTNGPPPPAPPVVLASAELYDPDSEEWTPTGSMSIAREDATATLLLDGRVLVAGGSTGGPRGVPFASAELYDPESGKWSRAGDMNVARVDHTATLLDDGTVLIAGGRGPSGPLASAELFNPDTNRFTLVENRMTTAREDHVAAKLSDGKVLIAGGEGPAGRLKSGEVYDPDTETWTATIGTMSDPRVDHIAVLLEDGTVLVAGGISRPENPVSSADLYTPASNSWAPTASMAVARGGHNATLLDDGTVLVTGGLSRPPAATASVERYQRAGDQPNQPKRS